MERLIAVGTKDGEIINDDHFGQSKIFSIFRLDGNNFVKIEERNNPYYDKHVHAKVEDILEIINDCKIWIGKSMGKGSMKKLKELNYITFLTSKDAALEAIEEFLELYDQLQ
ncbi:MAG: hypothetical protein PWQ20_1491 [Thermotogaceae bacterium]|nr:hypothetical protein [Thermotogaceae bacterium]